MTEVGGEHRRRRAGASPGPNKLKVTVPVGLTPPVTVAVSNIGLTGPPADGVVEIVGVAGLMSPARSPQAEPTVVLLASPLVDRHPVVGAHRSGGEGRSRGGAAPAEPNGRGEDRLRRRRVQVVSAGENSSKVTEPVGLKPLRTVAVSEIAVPTGPAPGKVGRERRGGLGDLDRLLPARGADGLVVGVAAVDGHPLVDAHSGRREGMPEVALGGPR